MVDDDRLIELVEMNECLYNRSHINYKSFAVKKKVWSNIAAELGVTENDAIKRYHVLRDRFVRDKRIALISGTEMKYRSPNMKRLEFITPHIFNRNCNRIKMAWSGKDHIPLNKSTTSSNIDPLNWNQDTSDHDDNDDPIDEVDNLPTKRKALELNETATCSGSEAADIDEAFCDALKSFKKLCQSREERKCNEALNGFGQMIIATIADMSAKKQAKAMIRVTEVVMQIKLEPED